MKNFIAIILIFTTMGIFSEDKSIEKEKDVTPVPYESNEFLPILKDVRRSSIIFCGAFPLGYMYSSLIGDPILSESSQFDDMEDDDISNEQIEIKLMSSLIFAGVVMLIDLIIEKLIRR